MPRMAQIDVVTNIVKNVVVADPGWSEAGFVFIASEDAGIDDRYDAANAAFIRPFVETPPDPATST